MKTDKPKKLKVIIKTKTNVKTILIAKTKAIKAKSLINVKTEKNK